MKARLAVGCIAIAALAVGCDDEGHPAPQQSPRPAPRIVVSRDDGSLPRRCGVVRTATRVAAFLDAVNRGDAPLLERMVADRDHFQWYSFSAGHGRRMRGFETNGLTSARDDAEGRPPPHVNGRPALMRYLAGRHPAGERMQLLELQITRIPPRGWFPSITYDVAGIDFLVRVDAPDLTSFPGHNRLAGGKGAFGCSDGRLLAWTMSLDTAGGRKLRASWTCRKASQRKGRWESATRRVVACSGY